MRLDALLPATSFLAFAVRRARDPAVRWVNPALAAGFPFAANAWCVPLPQDAPTAYRRRQRNVLAERYGGHGLGGNGGGARCGLLGDIQIKGIGRNALAAAETDFFHSYGGASLNEGMYEALWGELLHQALPHGAVRVLGLVTTGTRVPLVAPLPAQDPTTERALIFRQAALRPAHFMRSAYHRPPADSPLCSDTARTVAALRRLPAACAAIYGAAMDGEDGDALVRRCLGAMLERFADQFAAARAKRLMHGSLIASNIALDGRWLDFATASSMPDYGHIVSPRGPDFMREELMLQPGVADLAFYLRKYLAPQRPELFDGDALWQLLSARLRLRLPLEYAKLTGVPADVCERLPAHSAALYAVMDAIMRKGNTKTYVMMSDPSAAARRTPSRTGDHGLNAILRQAAFSGTPDATDAALRQQLDDAPLRARFVRAYWALRHEAEHTLTGRGRFGRLFLMLNAARLNGDNHFLYRPQLYHDIEQALLKGAPAAALIDATLRRGGALLADDAGGKASLDSILPAGAAVCARDGLSNHGRPCGAPSLLADAGALDHHEITIIRDHEAEIIGSASPHG